MNNEQIDEAKEREAFEAKHFSDGRFRKLTLDRPYSEANIFWQGWLAAKRHAASAPCPYIVTSPGGSSFCRLAESAQQLASAQAEPVAWRVVYASSNTPFITGKPQQSDLDYYRPPNCVGIEYAYLHPPATSREVPEEVAELLATIADNLNDMPISYEWASKTADKITALLAAATAAPKEGA